MISGRTTTFIVDLIKRNKDKAKMLEQIYEENKGEHPLDIFTNLEPKISDLTQYEANAIISFLRYEDRGHAGKNIKVMIEALNRLQLL